MKACEAESKYVMTLAEILSFVGDIVVTLGVFFLALFSYLLLAARRISLREDRELIEFTKALEQEQLIALRVETNDDQFLCYNARTDDFVCQGCSLTEIKQRFKQRFPDKDAAICSGDESTLTKLKEQVKDLHENNGSIRSTS